MLRQAAALLSACKAWFGMKLLPFFPLQVLERCGSTTAAARAGALSWVCARTCGAPPPAAAPAEAAGADRMQEVSHVPNLSVSWVKKCIKTTSKNLSHIRFPAITGMKGSGVGAGVRGGGEQQCREVFSAPSSTAAPWEAAEASLKICAKSYVSHGSGWVAHVLQVVTLQKEAEPGQNEREMSGSQVVCCHLALAGQTCRTNPRASAMTSVCSRWRWKR